MLFVCFLLLYMSVPYVTFLAFKCVNDYTFGLNIFLFGNIYRYKDNTHI